MRSVAAQPVIGNCSAGSDGTVIPVDIAAAKALAIAKPLNELERLALGDCAGRVLGTDQKAQLNLPPFDNSAMDGYAIRSVDLAGTSPWRSTLVGRTAAGDGAFEGEEIQNAAVRIFTGAPIPRGFDAVVMQEHCSRTGNEILIGKAPRPGENIRLAGEDVRSGEILVGSGSTINPQKIALLAAQGITHLDVVRKVRIGLISTGSELVDPGAALGPGRIYNSNRPMIHATLNGSAWAEVLDYGIIPDRQDELATAISRAAARCDVIVSTGGVSAGEGDHIVGALDQHGAALDVLRVAMRPGKPVKIGTIGGILFAGLPGNPNAALVTLHQIALPAIRAIAGIVDQPKDWQPAVSGFSYRKKLGRTEFVPVQAAGRDDLGRPVIQMLSRGSSASLSAMASADGIAVLPPEVETIDLGFPLRFEPFKHC